MNNKIILVIFTYLTLTTTILISVMATVTMYIIESSDKPNHITITKHTTINVSPEPKAIPKPKVKTEKPKAVKKTSGYDDYEIQLLAKLINAEAKGEPFNGKVAVGNVVLNRVKSDEFPDTVKDVIFQPRQFQPVSNGAINNEPSVESVKAAHKAIETNLIGKALYFYNPDIATDSWIKTRTVTNVIGNHKFAF